MDYKRWLKRMKDYIDSYELKRKFHITYDVIANILLFFVITALLLSIFAVGVGAGYFASLVQDEEVRPYEEMRKDIYNYEETSKLYFSDDIYIGDIRADLHREEVQLEDISELIIQAVIATEDELFYEHRGVVPKAILRALFQEATNADMKTGGSTLTQQLIKNQILTNEVSFERKAKEILLALRLENFFEKDEILEAYLNIVPYGREASGRNIAGIQTAAKGIFGIDADQVNLAQAAYLAGLPQNPFTYTPFTKEGKLKEEEELQAGINRMKTVLSRMFHTNMIDEKAYEEALAYDIVADFTEKSISPIDEYPAIVFELEQRTIQILKEILAKEDGYEADELRDNEELNEEYTILADRALRRNGYHIHSTINKHMYDKMQEIVANYPYFGPDRTIPETGKVEPVENGMVLIENSTGKILSFVPGRHYEAGTKEFNFATQAYRSPGSTFKPFTYAAGFELGKLQPGTVIADIPTSYGEYAPKNYGGAYYGLVTLREAITYSYNVTAVKAYSEIMNDRPVENFITKLGFSQIDASEAGNRALALGGLTRGVTVEENTGAFATFANGGAYNAPYMIEKITDKDGKVVYEHKSTPTQVFSPETAYLITDTLRDVVRHGTGNYMQSQLRHGGVDWAGKTGTSQDYRDAWFVAYNPKVTLGSWIGYETPASIYCPTCSLSYHPRNIKLWSQVVNELSETFPDLMAPKETFSRPDTIVSKNICASSGLLPSKICKEAGLVISELFHQDHIPTKKDDSLIGGSMNLTLVDGQKVIAHEQTPQEFVLKETGGISFNPDFLKRMKYDRLEDLSVLIPRKHSEKWGKIGLQKTKVSAKELSAEQGKKPPTPTNVKLSGKKVTWKHPKNELIVGYRIYRELPEQQTYTLIGHTREAAYTLPEQAGSYYIRAVNYFGEESKAYPIVVKEKQTLDDIETSSETNTVEKNENKQKKKENEEKPTEKKENDKNENREKNNRK